MANPKILPDQVDAIDAPANGETLAYNSATGKFEWVVPDSLSTLLTTRGDLVYRNATVPARLALGGVTGSALIRDANDPLWSASAAALVGASNTFTMDNYITSANVVALTVKRTAFTLTTDKIFDVLNYNNVSILNCDQSGVTRIYQLLITQPLQLSNALQFTNSAVQINRVANRLEFTSYADFVFLNSQFSTELLRLTSGGQLQKYGTSDVSQVVLRANSVQSAANRIISIQNSSGTEQVYISGDYVTGTKGRRQATRTVTANYTATVNDELIIFTTSATLTLPAATGTGQTYRIIARNCTVTIDANGSETIKGELTQAISNRDDFIISDTATGIWE